MFEQYRILIGAVVGLALLSWQFWPALSTYAPQALAWFTGARSTSPDASVSENTLDFQALERLQARFERHNCPEGKAAVDVCLQHFFHRGG